MKTETVEQLQDLIEEAKELVPVLEYDTPSDAWLAYDNTAPLLTDKLNEIYQKLHLIK